MTENFISQTKLSGFYIVYKGSTNLEKPGWRGLSHLMEHLVFKSVDHLQESFDRDGLNYNAYTSNNEIVFYLTGLDSSVNKWKDTFLNLLLNFQITEEEFENERKIVLEEYMDSFNEQSDAHYLNLFRKLFNDFSPIGSRQDLENLQYQDIIDFFNLQYAKPSKIINVSKDSKYYTELEYNTPEYDTKLEYGSHDVTLEINNEFADKTSIIALTPVINEDFGYVSFINSMLGAGLISPLYAEIREKRGLVYYIHCHLGMKNNQGVTAISTVTSNDNVEELLECLKEVISSPEKYITQERLEVIKDYFTVRKEINDVLRHERVTPFISNEQTIYDIVDTVTIEKIREVYAKYYNFENFYISTDKTEFKN